MENPADSKFCNQCGSNLQEATPERAPADYTPKHLSDKILQSKSALEGERKQVTVMFADVKGSMDLAGQLDPEDWHKILDRFFEILGEGVHRFEGTINQYTGDGIMALFGAPIAHEDHAQRACHAALVLRDTLSAFSDEVRRSHGVDFSTRIGLNSGEVVVGKIGDDLRMDYTAQGLAVGLAQRMESLAQDGLPYLTKYTAKLVEGFFDLENLGDFDVKGVSEPLTVYSLLGHGAVRNRLERSDGLGLSTFIGRDLEMATLKAAYTESLAGRGQVIGIVAGPGLGKSRLLREFSKYVKEAGEGYVITTHNPSHSKDVPLSSFLAAMRDEFRIDLRDTPDIAREKVIQRFTESFPESMEFCPLLCDFLGAPDPEHPLPQMSPEQRQQRIQEFQERNLKPRTQRECTIMIFEDVHWLDSVSETLFEYQINAALTVRQMCVCTYRPEYTPPSVSKSFFRQLPMLPLGEEANKLLIDNLLGPKLSDSELAIGIQHRCGGNPFFIEETIQSLAESGILTGERGNYTTTKSVDEIPFPSTVQAVLDARIDRLTEDEKLVLQTASIIGRNFLRSILQSVVGLDDAALNAAIETLKNSEFIFEESQYPEIEYSFKHALTQDAAYASQLTERRQSLHTLVAEQLEEYFANQLDEKAALIAQHWELSGNSSTAAEWYARAAKWASVIDMNASVEHWQQVRELLRDLHDQPETAQLGLASCTEQLNLVWRTGATLDEARELLREGENYADALGDRRARLILSMRFSRILGGSGQLGEYVERTKNDLTIASEIDDSDTLANAWLYFADANHWRGRFRESLEMANHGLEHAPRDIPREKWVMGFNPFNTFSFWRALNLCWMGRTEIGLEGLQQFRQLADEDESPEWHAYIPYWEAQINYYRANSEQASKSALDVEEACKRMGEPLNMVGVTHSSAAYAHLASGRGTEAAECARAAIDAAQTVEKHLAGPYTLVLADALLLSGDLDAAVATSEEAIQINNKLPSAHFEAHAHGVLACARLRRDGESAIRSVETALAMCESLIEESGAELLSPFLNEWCAELADVRKEDASKKDLLQQALAGYKEIGADGHVVRLQKEWNI